MLVGARRQSLAALGLWLVGPLGSLFPPGSGPGPFHCLHSFRSRRVTLRLQCGEGGACTLILRPLLVLRPSWEDLTCVGISQTMRVVKYQL